MMKKVLTIAGSDCSGGAGIQADLKTMSALGVFGMSVIVSVVAENTMRVAAVENMSGEMTRAQMACIFEDMGTDAVKIGMLGSEEIMHAVADGLQAYVPRHIVFDPVMYAKNGYPLMPEDTMRTLMKEVVPLADVVTPNIPEAEFLAQCAIHNEDDMVRAAMKIAATGCRAVLVKGGHRTDEATDILYAGGEVTRFTGRHIESKDTHGTGCTLSSAIASYLALGEELERAISLAKEYVTGCIVHAPGIGKGNGALHHFWRWYGDE